MQLFEVDIDVKNPGLLEVPAGKEVDQLPKSHFEKLIAKKGYEKIIRGLTNLEVWNKNKNPKLSKWASDMANSLKHLQPASEALLEASLKLKALTKGKKALKAIGKYAKETASKSADTARNAIVAGAVAPVGAGIAQKYTNRPKKRDQKYSTTDVAAIATAMKNKSESYSEKFDRSLLVLEKDDVKKIAKGAATGTAVGGAAGAVGLGKVAHHLTGGIKGTVASGVGGKLIRGGRIAAKVLGGARGAITGLAVGTAAGTAKAIHDKIKKNKNKNEQLIESLIRLKTLVEEEGVPKKKRFLSPEQKARRQERRRLRRQLNKQGLSTSKAGKVSTSQGPQKVSQGAIDAAKKAQNAKPVASSAPNKITTDKIIGKPPLKVPPQPKEIKPASQVLQNAAKEISKKTSKAPQKTAQSVFKKTSALRNVVKKAGKVGALKGAAGTAVVGAGLLGAKKLLDKNKKK